MGRMVIAGALVGLVAIWLPEVMGTGTATMKDLFGGATIPLATLLVLAVAETFLTPAALGAGFVGGVIGPSMLIGSTLGSAVGTVVIAIFPDLGLSPVVFAMVGTAAMLAGSFHAPIFGALMVFEMTGSYEMLVPLVIAAAIGYGAGAPVPGRLGLHDRPPRAGDLPRARDLPADGSMSDGSTDLRQSPRTRSIPAATVGRCEMTMVVRPAMNGASDAIRSRSVATSRLAVASSRMRIGASLRIARAMASR